MSKVGQSRPMEHPMSDSRLHELRPSRAEARGDLVVLAALSVLAGSIAGCRSGPVQESLSPVDVVLRWERRTGDPRVVVDWPSMQDRDGVVVLAPRITAVAARVAITRDFQLTPIATLQSGSAPAGAATSNLSTLAAESLRRAHPGLDRSAEVEVGPGRIAGGTAVVEVDRRLRDAEVEFDVLPEAPVLGEPVDVELRARATGVALVDRDDPSRVLVVGSSVGDGRFEVPINQLQTADCRVLRDLLLGAYAIKIDYEVQLGVRSGPSLVSSAVVDRPERLERLEMFDDVRTAARRRLAELAVDKSPNVFELVIADDRSDLIRGASWPALTLRNRIRTPVLDVSAVTVAYRLGSSDGTESEVVVEHPVPPCLCPEDPEVLIQPAGRIPAAGSSATIEVDAFWFAPTWETLDVLAGEVRAFPRADIVFDPVEVLADGSLRVQAEVVGGVAGRDLELRVAPAGQDPAVRLAFPDISPRGTGEVVLPADLTDPAARAAWADLSKQGGRLTFRLLERPLWSSLDAGQSVPDVADTEHLLRGGAATSSK